MQYRARRVNLEEKGQQEHRDFLVHLASKELLGRVDSKETSDFLVHREDREAMDKKANLDLEDRLEIRVAQVALEFRVILEVKAVQEQVDQQGHPADHFNVSK